MSRRCSAPARPQQACRQLMRIFPRGCMCSAMGGEWAPRCSERYSSAQPHRGMIISAAGNVDSWPLGVVQRAPTCGRPCWPPWDHPHPARDSPSNGSLTASGTVIVDHTVTVFSRNGADVTSLGVLSHGRFNYRSLSSSTPTTKDASHHDRCCTRARSSSIAQSRLNRLIIA